MQPSDRHPHNYAPRYGYELCIPDALLSLSLGITLPVILHYGAELLGIWWATW
jgi:hypothetical protein